MLPAYSLLPKRAVRICLPTLSSWVRVSKVYGVFLHQSASGLSGRRSSVRSLLLRWRQGCARIGLSIQLFSRDTGTVQNQWRFPVLDSQHRPSTHGESVED